ncbi:MAG: 1-acyl-sn-glycerol-3-phosphate acyltransferase, partial [Deltaproteobacteria bacterium]|nr:1-acyl-sn-glycerol-3-phosphate acyltransferase [Deltaproteobacteria bacterium]
MDKDNAPGTLLPLLYSPYTFGVFAPFLGASTLAWGSVATLIAQVSPRLSFHCGTAWAWSLCHANFTKVAVEGREKIDPKQSYIIMTNHQSHFDVLAFYGHWKKQFRWVMKKELRHIPGLGPACAAAGHVFIDRSSREAAIESLHNAREILDGGTSVVIFPEGTRSRDGRMGPFKKGGFMMALDTDLPILPVSISGSRGVLPAYTAKLLPGKIRLQIHDPVDVTRYGNERRDALMADVRRAIA